MEAYDCCKDLLKETTKFNIILINVNKNVEMLVFFTYQKKKNKNSPGPAVDFSFVL